MMRRCYKQPDTLLPSNVNSDCERGAMLIVCLFGIVALLAVAGLAIDAGNLYRSRIWLQKSADAAALAGIGYTIERGTTGLSADASAEGFGTGDVDRIKKLVEIRSDEILRENLRLVGLTASPCTNSSGENYCSNYDVATRTLGVNVTANVNLLVMDLVPFSMIGLNSVAKLVQITAEAQSERPSANVELVLDVSASMGCPADSATDCGCRTPGNGPCQAPLKIDRLIDGVVQFAEFFDVDKDKLGVVPFNMRGMSVPDGLAGTVGTIIDRHAVQCVLSGQSLDDCGLDPSVEPRGPTNVCDGLIAAYEEVRLKGVVDKEDIAYLVFSDGGPTAGRFLFANAPGLPINDPESFGNSAKDYTHYMVQQTPSDGSQGFYSPSLIAKTDRLWFQYLSPYPPAGASPGDVVPICHNYSVNGSKSERGGPQNSEDFCKPFDGCINDLSFRLPHDTTIYDAGFKCNGSDVRSREDSWRQLYYHCALAMADYMRTKRGTFFVVGLGPDKPITADPYQALDDDMSRKDVFLTRIANDYMHSVSQRTEDGDQPMPEFTFDQFKKYDDWNSQSLNRQGEYEASPEAGDMNRIFKRMAKRIQLRLIR